MTIEGEEKNQASPTESKELDQYGEWVKSHKELLIAEIKAIENRERLRGSKNPGHRGPERTQSGNRRTGTIQYEKAKTLGGESL